MFYKTLNYYLEKKISKLRPIVKRILKGDLQEQEKLLKRKKDRTDIVAMDFIDVDGVNKCIETIKKRLQIENKYVILIDHFKKDSKRKYMINQNYCKYLEAIKYLYTTSEIMVKAGILTAPSEIYFVINEAEKCFDELIERNNLM